MELPVYEFRGSPRGMGEAFGEAVRGEIHELYARRFAAAVEFARTTGGRAYGEAEVMGIVRACLPITEAYDRAGYEEFCGIARGAGVTPEQLYVTQGLTDLRDVLVSHGGKAGVKAEEKIDGCSSFAVMRERAEGGKLLVGQTWDLDADNVPFVCLVHRVPEGGEAETWSLTLTGCLTLIGMSSAGIAVGNTNLRTRDARVGLQYLSVLHRAVRSGSFEEACGAIAGAQRAAAHYFYVADGKNQMAGLECSAEKSVRLLPRDGVMVHCNHTLTEEIGALQEKVATQSTFCRQPRMTELIAGAKGGVGVADLKGFMADHEGGENAICRHEYSGSNVATNACVIMSPETGEMHACRGQSHVGVWKTVKFG